MAVSRNSSDAPLTPRRPTGFRASGDRRERCSLRESAHIQRKRLVFSEEGNTTTSSGMTVHTQMWSEDEIKALLEFFLFHGQAGVWPCHKREVFWKGAASYVKIRSKSSHERSGKHFLS